MLPARGLPATAQEAEAQGDAPPEAVAQSLAVQSSGARAARLAMSSVRAELRSRSRNAQPARVPMAASAAQTAEAAAAQVTAAATTWVTAELAAAKTFAARAVAAGREASRAGRSVGLACRRLVRSEARWGDRSVVARRATSWAMVQAAGADPLTVGPVQLAEGSDQLAERAVQVAEGAGQLTESGARGG